MLEVAPFIQMQGLLSAGGTVQKVLINAVDPNEESKVSIIDQFFQEGSLSSLKPGEFGILIGDKAAKNLGVKLGDQMVDSGIDPTGIYNKVKAFLASHPDTNGIITLGPNSADPTIKYLGDTGSRSKFKSVISFDLDADISKAIKDGTMDAAIDQQPYLQGYLPIVFLTQYVRYGVMPANNVNTGPGFVTKKNIELVEKLAGEYR